MFIYLIENVFLIPQSFAVSLFTDFDSSYFSSKKTANRLYKLKVSVVFRIHLNAIFIVSGKRLLKLPVSKVFRLTETSEPIERIINICMLIPLCIIYENVKLN